MSFLHELRNITTEAKLDHEQKVKKSFEKFEEYVKKICKEKAKKMQENCQIYFRDYDSSLKFEKLPIEIRRSLEDNGLDIDEQYDGWVHYDLGNYITVNWKK